MTPTPARVGLLGGSFNPVHNGHLAIARAMLANGVADEVRLLVSPQNPLKKKTELLDENARLSLARLACEGESSIHASDFEFHLPRPSYTWLTLEALREVEPDKSFVLLIGADNWELFPHWYHANDIMRNYRIAIYPRRGYNVCTKSLPQSVEFVDMPLFDISSTMIRRLIKEGEDVSDMLPSKVYNEIKSQHLYAC